MADLEGRASARIAQIMAFIANLFAWFMTIASTWFHKNLLKQSFMLLIVAEVFAFIGTIIGERGATQTVTKSAQALASASRRALLMYVFRKPTSTQAAPPSRTC